MKRKLLTLFLMVFALAVLLVPAQTAATEADYCDMAEDTCRPIQAGAVSACRERNDGSDCFCEGVRAFNACTAQFGCTGYTEQQMIERGCGPQ